MLNIHICTYFDTFNCKETTCVSPRNVTIDRGNKIEIKVVFNDSNLKRDFFLDVYTILNRI